MKHTLLGILFWSLMLAAALLAIFLVLWFGAMACSRIDWLAVKRFVTWAVWLQLLWSIGFWFRAKGRKA